MTRALLLPLLLAAAPAIAGGPEYHVGPSCSLMEFRPGLPNPVALAPGLGVQAGLEWPKWHVDAALFGNAVAALGGGTGGEASAAVFGCYAPAGICAGPLVVLAGPDGGLVHGFTWKRSVGFVFSLSWAALDFLHATTAPPAPPTAADVGRFGP